MVWNRRFLIAERVAAKVRNPPNSAGARGNYERQVCGVKSGSRGQG
jgi:hypothetical protein